MEHSWTLVDRVQKQEREEKGNWPEVELVGEG